MELLLKAKDLDSYVSFLGRLNKLGYEFVVKNDVISPMHNGTISGSGDVIPGLHFVQDPLFPTDEEDYVKDAVYAMSSLDKLVELFRDIRTNHKEERTDIRYIRTKDGAYIRMGNLDLIPIFTLNDLSEHYDEYCANMEFVSTFDEMLAPHEDQWSEMTKDQMVQIRNNAIATLSQSKEDGVHGWARIAKSVFPMAGTGKKDTPIALGVRYDFTGDQDIENSHVLTLTLAADYKPSGSSTLIKVRCIHEYWVFIF